MDLEGKYRYVSFRSFSWGCKEGIGSFIGGDTFLEGYFDVFEDKSIYTYTCKYILEMREIGIVVRVF